MVVGAMLRVSLCVIIALVNILEGLDSQLHAPVSCARISNKDCDLFLWPSLLAGKHFVAELGGIDR